MSSHLKSNRQRRIEIQSQFGRWIVKASDELYTDSAVEAFEYMQKLENAGYEASANARNLGKAAANERASGKPKTRTLETPQGKVRIKPRGGKSATIKYGGVVTVEQMGRQYNILVGGKVKYQELNANDAYTNLRELANQGYRVSASDLEQLRIRGKLLRTHESGGIRRTRVKRRRAL